MASTSPGRTAAGEPRRPAGRALSGLLVRADGGSLAGRTVVRHAAALGAEADSHPGGPPAGELAELSGSGLAAACVLEDRAGLATGALDEETLQARCGLVEVHGRQLRRPAFLGIEVVSVTTGVLAVSGLLACLLAQLRGGRTSRCRTSAIEAGLFPLTHYFASATCGDDWEPPAQDGEPGPPFCSADGHWFELETLSPDCWNRFWLELGVAGPEVTTSWMGVVFRYVSATSRVHPSLHDATLRRPLREIAEVARANGVSVCRLRPLPEVVEALCSPGQTLRVPAPWTIAPEGTAGPRQRAARPPADPGLPLEGVKVVEVTRRIQGPTASLVLALLGAEVVRVEPPGGDPMRLMHPLTGDASARFLALNRGKRVEEIDIKTPAGHRALLELVAGADVFLQNWAPGRARSLGLDHPDLAAVAPELVYGSISDWDPADAPPGSPIGTDFLVQAHAGMGEALNPAGVAPFPSLVTLTDVFGGLVGAEGILAALVLREREGVGARVDSSLHSAAMALEAHVLEAHASGQAADRKDGRARHARREVPAAAGLVAVAADPSLAGCFEEIGGCLLPARPWRFSA